MMTGVRKISVVHIGNFSIGNDGKVYSLKTYASFLNELRGYGNELSVFGGLWKKTDPAYEFSNETALDDRIKTSLSPGNSPDTPLHLFIWNNIRLLFRLISFSLKRNHYFLFLPSPIGIWSLIVIRILKKVESVGLYVGGHYGDEQKFEKRTGVVKQLIKQASAKVIDKGVHYAIRHSDYVITSSYKYYEQYKKTTNIFLTPPLINVTEKDLIGESVLKGDRTQTSSNEITYCGELRHAKGIIDLVKAFFLLLHNNSDVNLTLKIIGSGQAGSELKALVKELKISEHVKFCGQIKDVEKLKEELRSSLMFVLPSYSEGFPRVGYECFTLGVPTILTAVGGIPYLVKDGKECLFVKPGDVEDIVQKILLMATDESLRLRLIRNAANLMRLQIFPRIQKEGSLAKMIIRKIETVHQ